VRRPLSARINGSTRYSMRVCTDRTGSIVRGPP
jgi:hypothetical protein